MDYSPIVIFAYNRPDHLSSLIESLSKCELVDKSVCYIFCDNWKKEKDRSKVEETRRIADEYANKGIFSSTEVIKAEKNKGLANSIIEGITQIMRKYGSAIVLEDDLILNRYFLSYMNSALSFYQNNRKIWAISGYTYDLPYLKQYKHDVYIAKRGCSWGWATWKDRWDLVDWSVSDYNSFKHNLFKRVAFGRWGHDMPTMLDAQMNGEINSWAIRWCYSSFKNNMYTVYPKRSLVKNEGCDGSGTHFNDNSTNTYDVQINNTTGQLNLENVKENRFIRSQFSKATVCTIKYRIYWLLRRIRLIG